MGASRDKLRDSVTPEEKEIYDRVNMDVAESLASLGILQRRYKGVIFTHLPTVLPTALPVTSATVEPESKAANRNANGR